MSRQIKTLDQLKDSRLLYEKKLPRFGYIITVILMALLTVIVIWSIYTPKIYVIKSAGAVQSDNKNYVMSPYTGKISEMQVKEGQVVEKGDILFQVESTDLNLQVKQLGEKKKSYETRVSQFEKLVKSIKDNKNYFDIAIENDSLYYSQFEAYKSKVDQSQVDVSSYKAYGYTDEQIEKQLVSNQAKITEIYYTAIQTAETSILDAQTQIGGIDAQIIALKQGQGQYTITANASGIVHMMSDYKEGMVVQAAAAIASIASSQDTYTIIAYMSPSDVARTKVGDSTDVEIAGLNQSIYGTITGKITGIDSDITTSKDSATGESTSYFKVYITPDEKYLVSKAGNIAYITNGMSVEARVQYDNLTYGRFHSSNYDYIRAIGRWRITCGGNQKDSKG